jgi:hypothetical protein
MQGTDPIVSIRTDEALCYAWRNGTCPDQERSPRKEPTSPWARWRAHGLVGFKKHDNAKNAGVFALSCFYLARLLLFYNILNIPSRIGSEPELKSQAHTIHVL